MKHRSVKGKTLIPDNVTDVSPHCSGFARHYGDVSDGPLMSAFSPKPDLAMRLLESA